MTEALICDQCGRVADRLVVYTVDRAQGIRGWDQTTTTDHFCSTTCLKLWATTQDAKEQQRD